MRNNVKMKMINVNNGGITLEAGVTGPKTINFKFPSEKCTTGEFEILATQCWVTWDNLVGKPTDAELIGPTGPKGDQGAAGTGLTNRGNVEC